MKTSTSVSLGVPPEQLKRGPIADSIRMTMFEIQESCNSFFRHTYQRVADQAVELAIRRGCRHIVELGAGTAPITKILAQDPRTDGMKLTICDIVPDVAAYDQFRAQYPEKVNAITSSVDFGKVHDWGPGTLLVLVNTFPAIPEDERTNVLKVLTNCSDAVMVFEASRNSIKSMMISMCALIPGWLLPFTMIRHPGFLRRFLWCLTVPAAPWLYVRDALWWNRRCWLDSRWRDEISRIAGPSRPVGATSQANSQVVVW